MKLVKRKTIDTTSIRDAMENGKMLAAKSAINVSATSVLISLSAKSMFGFINPLLISRVQRWG